MSGELAGLHRFERRGIHVQTSRDDASILTRERRPDALSNVTGCADPVIPT